MAGSGPDAIANLFQGRAEVTIAGRERSPVITVELARTPDERSQGLMFRKVLAADAGMLFVMPGDDRWGFYMRNTYISLDMLFVDSQGEVVGLLANVPPLTEDTRKVERPSRYVLELAAHRASELRIDVGTHLIIRQLPDAGLPDPSLPDAPTQRSP